MRYYHSSNSFLKKPLFVLLLVVGIATGMCANAAQPASSIGEEYAYVRIFSAKISDELSESLDEDEIEAIAREQGTEEVAMFLKSDGPEKQAERRIVRLGSEEYGYPPGLTVKARTHLAEQKKRGALQMSSDGRRASEVLAHQNARLQWVLPESVRSPLLCDVSENGKLIAKNSIQERLSPSGLQRWPEVIRIELPQRDWGIIQVFEYLDEMPEGLEPVEDETIWHMPFGKSAVRERDRDGTKTNSGDIRSTAEDTNSIEKKEPVLFSASWPSWGGEMGLHSGWQPRGSPVQIRFDMDAAARLSSSIAGEFDLVYDPCTREGDLTLGASSGPGELEINFGVEMSSRGRVGVDLGLKEVEFTFDIPYAPNFDFRCYDTNSFDSYFISSDSPVRVADWIEPQELYSMDVAGVPKIASVTVAAMAQMELWAEMWTASITTDSVADPGDPCSISEHCNFTSEGQTRSVNLRDNNAYIANADYDEHLEMGMIVTFYPEVCVEVDVWIYEWDYCVSVFALPVKLCDGPLDLDISSELRFEATYDFILTATSPGADTVPPPDIYSGAPPTDISISGGDVGVRNLGVYSWYDVNQEHNVCVTATTADAPAYEFDCWILDGNDVNEIANPQCCVYFDINDSNNVFHSLHAIFFRAKATEPFPGDLEDKTGKLITLSWVPGERVASQDLYFGTSFDVVDNATNLDPMGPNEVYRAHLNAADTEYIIPEELQDCETYYWRVDEVNDPCLWEGMVWKFRTIGCCASEPSPPNCAADEPRNVQLSWKQGELVADANHHLYLGTDFDEVNDANISTVEIYRGVRDTNSCIIPELAAILPTTYYWRVDEANDAYQNDPSEHIKYPWKGAVWKLTVQHVVVDDFERYNDIDKKIYDTWIDGFEDFNSGSEVALETSSDYVHGGEKSMKYIYNNSLKWPTQQGYFSEIAADIVSLEVNEIGGDWTDCDIKALVLQFYGEPNNDCSENERLYIALEDNDLPTAGYGLVQFDRDANDMNEWNVELQEFADQSVNLANLKKIYIGFGELGNPPGGSGTVWFDDIRLYPPRCRPDCAIPEGDIEGRDCFVNSDDLALMGRDWLRSDYIVEATEPNSNSLVVKYTFDTDLTDTSGNGYDGVGVNGPVITADGLLRLNGSNFVNIGNNFNEKKLFDGLSDFSIAMQFQTETPGILISSARDKNPENHSMAVFVAKLGPNRGAVFYGNYGLGTAGSEDNPLDNEWHHVVVTYDTGNLHRVYLDGIVGWDNEFDPCIPDANFDTTRIGGSRNDEFPDVNSARDLDLDFVGDINSIHIYDYSLSAEEVCYLFNESNGCAGFLLPLFSCSRPCYQPLKSVANLVPRDPAFDVYNPLDPNVLNYDPNDPNTIDIVNFRDYAKMSANWLVDILWP